MSGLAAEHAIVDQREVAESSSGTGAMSSRSTWFRCPNSAMRSDQWWAECDGLELALRDRRDAVLEEPPRQRRAHPLADGDLAARVRTDHERLVAVVAHEPPALVLVERLVHLDELAAGELHDATRLVAVQHDLAVLLLQRDADALGDEVGDERTDDHDGLEGVDDALHREREVRREDVGARRRPEARRRT